MSERDLSKILGAGDSGTVSSSGMDLSEKTRSASFLQADNAVEFTRSTAAGVEIYSIEDALKRVPGAKEYYGRAFGVMQREFPADTQGGYFIRVRKGTTVELPIQACLFLKKQGFRQQVHNVVIIEEGARVYLITGCSASEAASEGFHLGVSEFFVGRGAYLNFTMIHSWREDVSVKPVSIALIDEDAQYVSNYVCMKPVRDVTMYPTALLAGDRARASLNSLILSHPGSRQDVGSRVIMRGRHTQAEIVSRAVSLGGHITARGHLKAENADVRGHLECRGLILAERGTIYAVPEMESDYRDVEMSHEAAIGKINNEQIEYLCSRGFSRDQAQSIIVRGFMDVDVLGLPEMLRKEIEILEEGSLADGF